ncbi:cytochrome c peroxidase [Pelomonas sp. APW6]|uniref:Cytochrome c peroxidase n=1 Tax=Roseateles subflavus TaxID=3053353 RepID=A0ABT7LCS1_9BURK|nr:cytochrome c peroxidase [Pelomonas sp. APW6]MDL5030665.1 cytochrome c peroxidase [Pelomonas sp. APW6]
MPAQPLRPFRPFARPRPTHRAAILAAGALLSLSALVGCGGGGGGGTVVGPTTTPEQAALARVQLGERLFNDRNLSGSGRMSCATCHDPAFAHGPSNALPVQVGGAFETEFGLRAAPSLRYLDLVPAFSRGDGSLASLRGGLMSDGRAASLEAQARLPFLNPLEMDNGSVAVLAGKLRRAAYAPLFVQVFGETADDELKLTQATQALAAFQRESAQFHPFDSKYDRVLQSQAQLTPPEQRGLQLFRDPAKGNCMSCHDIVTQSSVQPRFTNFGYAVLGVPRNPDLPANRDPAYFDQGLCGPQRQDLATPAVCGAFRTPNLRNVARRPVFFHNGRFNSLMTVLEFYNTRDSDPGRWYPTVNGVVQRFDDLPVAVRGNVNVQAPFGSATPRMTAAELGDLLCFLETLSDGYQPGTPPREGCRP